MRSNKACLADAKLYLILDTQVNSYPELLEILRISVRNGVDIVQLRDKTGHAKDILDFAAKAKAVIRGRVPFIMNDRVDLALLARTSGVHLGQDDIPIAMARRILGPKMIIGASCQDFERARRAQREGADYIGFGSVFKTLTKPERSPMDLKVLQKVIRTIKVPVFAIGGITFEHIGPLQQLGVERFAVCRDICKAKDVPRAVRRLAQSLQAI